MPAKSKKYRLPRKSARFPALIQTRFNSLTSHSVLYLPMQSPFAYIRLYRSKVASQITMSIASIDLGSSPSPLDRESEHTRLQARAIALVTCSATWHAHCALRLKEIEAHRSRIIKPTAVVRALDHAAIYPPGGKHHLTGTRMKRCRYCGYRWYPPQYVHDSGICQDCLEASHIALPETDELTHEMSTSSPTTMALLAMEEYQCHLTESRLPPEDEQSLLREIASAACA